MASTPKPLRRAIKEKHKHSRKEAEKIVSSGRGDKEYARFYKKRSEASNKASVKHEAKYFSKAGKSHLGKSGFVRQAMKGGYNPKTIETFRPKFED